MSGGRLDPATGAPEPTGAVAGGNLDEITAGAARAVARTLAADGSLGAIIREAAETAVRSYLQAAAKTALTAALEGDFGAALDEQVEQALSEALGGSDTESDERATMFANVNDWVVAVLLPNHARPVELGGPKWCPYWWEHAEAVSRLTATWRAWEHLRHEGPTGPAVWFRDYCDPMMNELTSPGGVFHSCKATRNQHVIPEVWASAEPPAGLFRSADHPEEQ